MTSLLTAAPTLLASGDTALGAGFIAFVVVLALAVACYFLLRSMFRHLKQLPPSFDPPAAGDDVNRPAGPPR